MQAKQACKNNSDWMFGGDGAYAPHPSSAVDMKLRLHEIVNVLDIGLVAHPARALLDSGVHQTDPRLMLAVLDLVRSVVPQAAHSTDVLSCRCVRVDVGMSELL